MIRTFKIGKRTFLVEFYLRPFKVNSISDSYRFDLLSIIIPTKVLKGIRIIFCHFAFRFNWVTRHHDQNVRVEGE